MSGASFIRNGRFSLSHVPLRVLISLAFGVSQADQVLNLPDWANAAKYDINATTSVAAPTKVLVLALLKERFHLEAHQETREIPTYELVIARPDGRLGPGLQPVTVDCQALALAGRGGCRLSGNGPLHTADGVPLALLIGQISGSVDRRIVDKTGLSGQFSWRLQTQSDPNDASAPSIFTALQEQLGLKLQPARGTLDVIVVDHVEPPTPD
jgi:uncharacterized protein (TIGR03435 family)